MGTLTVFLAVGTNDLVQLHELPTGLLVVYFRDFERRWHEERWFCAQVAAL